MPKITQITAEIVDCEINQLIGKTVTGSPMEVIKEFQKICVPKVAQMETQEYCEFLNQAHGHRENTGDPEKVIRILNDTKWFYVKSLTWDDSTTTTGFL